MGYLLRLAITAAVLLLLVRFAEYTAAWPKDASITEMNEWFNSLLVPQWAVARFALTHELTMYVRNVIGGSLLYHIGCGLWSLYIYVLRRGHFYPDPSKVSEASAVCDLPESLERRPFLAVLREF